MARHLHRAASADQIQSKESSLPKNSGLPYAESVAGLLLQIENQSRPSKTEYRREQKHFGRINLARIREIQKLCRQANENKNIPVKPQHSKLNEMYRHVPSRLSEYLGSRTSRQVGEMSNRDVLDDESLPYSCRTDNDLQQPLHTSLKFQPTNYRYDRKLESRSRIDQQIPQLNLTKNEINKIAQRKPQTYENRTNLVDTAALRTSTQPKSSLSTSRNSANTNLLLPAKYKLGTVPKYLQVRQKSWLEEAERRKAEKPDPNIPLGHDLVSEEERIETLDKLRNNYSDLLKRMSQLPIRMDTLRIQQQKETLEKRLVKIEEAVKVFSQPKVFIKKNM